MQKISNKIRRSAYVVCGLLFFISAVTAWPRGVQAQAISYDPYADAVAGTALLVTDANNAVGAPNGTSASLVGPGTTLTLDMGSGEEGTQTLRLHLGQINGQLNVDVAFLDGNKNVITTENRQLGVDLDPSVQNFAYNWTQFGKAYRFVSVSSALGGGVNVDAVEALGYIGSTPLQDTDGDGRPDREEQANGTDPLVPNPAPSGTAAPIGPIPGVKNTGAKTGGVSEQANQPPATNNDQDGDGMADDWEREHGLDPTDPKDATGDPDHDGLKNRTEYRINSNPQKMDTDGDGMPDDWEFAHGLDITANDADGDPDGDFLTNLGEYRHNTDPNKADDLHEVFGKDCLLDKAAWLWLAALVLIALLGWMAIKKSKANHGGSTRRKTGKKVK